MGDDVTIHPQAKIVYPECLHLGNAIIIDDFCLILARERTEIQDFVHIGGGSTITGGGTFLMERFAGLSGGVFVYTGNEDYSGASLTNPTIPLRWRNVTRSRVILRRHAIVGANSVILPGVEIGEGAVVGANSLVRADVEPWSINVGSPARKVGTRPSGTIRRMERELEAHCYRLDGSYVARRFRDDGPGAGPT